MFAIQKMHHYLTDLTINVITRVNPLRLLITKTRSLNHSLVKCHYFCSLMIYTLYPQNVLKRHAIADFLAKHPIPEDSKLHKDTSDEATETNTVFKEQA